MTDSVQDVTETSDGQTDSGAWLSLEDAARFLAVTVRTLNRRGLPKRRLTGRPTEVWVVGATSDDVRPSSETSDGHDETSAERMIALSERVSDVVGRQMAPLLVELATSRERIEALARENGVVTERLEAVTAERDELRTTVATLEDHTAPQTVEPSSEPPVALRWLWARWWPLVAMLVGAIVLAAVLLLVPR